MMHEEEKISVIIPTYNREPYLLEAINCFLEQNYNNKELLILDDSDLPSEKIQFLSQQHTAIRYIYQKERLTIGEKLNKLIELAQGSIIARFDDDDLYAPEYLSSMINQLKTKNCDFIKLSAWFVYCQDKHVFAYWDTSFVAEYQY